MIPPPGSREGVCFAADSFQKLLLRFQNVQGAFQLAALDHAEVTLCLCVYGFADGFVADNIGLSPNGIGTEYVCFRYREHIADQQGAILAMDLGNHVQEAAAGAVLCLRLGNLLPVLVHPGAEWNHPVDAVAVLDGIIVGAGFGLVVHIPVIGEISKILIADDVKARRFYLFHTTSEKKRAEPTRTVGSAVRVCDLYPAPDKRKV